MCLSTNNNMNKIREKSTVQKKSNNHHTGCSIATGRINLFYLFLPKMGEIISVVQTDGTKYEIY